MTADLLYFSSVSENTRRFVDKLGLPSGRLPVRRGDEHLVADRPFVLVTPTYGARGRGSVPPQVVAFLNDVRNRSQLRGVIAAGNTNFGADYCLAGSVISVKCSVPVLYRFELMGTPRDVSIVREGLAAFWDANPASTPSTEGRLFA